MTKILAMVAALAAAVSFTSAATAASNSEWTRFSTTDLTCSLSKPGGAEGVACVVKSGQLDGYGLVFSPYGVQISNRNDRTIYKKTPGLGDGPSIPYGWPTGYPLRNEGVACNKNKFGVGCLIRSGELAGWGLVMDGDTIEVSSMSGSVKFHRGRSIDGYRAFSAKSSASTSARSQAARMAREYLSSQAFSKSGLVEQLMYEGFSRSAATYGATHAGANWYVQAVKSAKEYLSSQSFSPSGLVEQLEYEGFSHAQAAYGVRRAYR